MTISYEVHSLFLFYALQIERKTRREKRNKKWKHDKIKCLLFFSYAFEAL